MIHLTPLQKGGRRKERRIEPPHADRPRSNMMVPTAGEGTQRGYCILNFGTHTTLEEIRACVNAFSTSKNKNQEYVQTSKQEPKGDRRQYELKWGKSH